MKLRVYLFGFFRYYYVYSYIIIGGVAFFVATTTMDLSNPETYCSVLAIGEDLSILFGVGKFRC